MRCSKTADNAYDFRPDLADVGVADYIAEVGSYTPLHDGRINKC